MRSGVSPGHRQRTDGFLATFQERENGTISGKLAYGLFALAVGVAGGVPAATVAWAQDQSARNGMIFAYRWCSTCHLDPAHPAPPFETIANERDVTMAYLRDRLEKPLHGMIRFDVSEEELVNLYNFFMSLRK